MDGNAAYARDHSHLKQNLNHFCCPESPYRGERERDGEREREREREEIKGER